MLSKHICCAIETILKYSKQQDTKQSQKGCTTKPGLLSTNAISSAQLWAAVFFWCKWTIISVKNWSKDAPCVVDPAIPGLQMGQGIQEWTK